MPWLSEAMKDVISCDKLRLGANNHLIRRSPNGATYPDEVRKSSEQSEEANPGN